jgi:hypothetical protein
MGRRLVWIFVLAFVAPAIAAVPPASIENTPRANRTYLLTSSTRTKSALKAPGASKPMSVVDVVTNVIEFETGKPHFDGGIPVSVRLVDSQASAIGPGLQPIERQSPLAPVVGASAHFLVYPGGAIEHGDVELPTQSAEQNKAAFAEFAKNVLRPIPSRDPPLRVGDEFESRATREFPIENRRVRLELLHRYRIATISPTIIELTYQIAVRPLTPNQPEQVYGRGSGAARYDRREGIVTKTIEKLNIAGQLDTRKDSVVFESETSTESLVQVISGAAPAPKKR